MKLFIKISAVVFLILAFFYFSAIVLLPQVFNIEYIRNYVISKLEEKTGVDIEADNPKFLLSYNLKIHFSADEFSAKKDGVEFIKVENLSFSSFPFDFSKGTLFVDKIYFKRINEKTDKKRSVDFLPVVLKFPQAEIKYAELKLGENEDIIAQNISFSGENERKLSLDLTCKLKNIPYQANIKKDSLISVKKNEIKTDNLSVYFGNSKLDLNGVLYSKKGADIIIEGSDVPFSLLEKFFVSIYRFKKNKKCFIENFQDFNGKTDINLRYNNEGFFGTVVVKNLYARAFSFLIPMEFKNVIFNFDNKDVLMTSKGKVNGEDAIWNFYLTGLLTNKLEVSGSLKTFATNELAKNCIKNLKIKNKIGLNVEYLTKDGTTNVIYTAMLPHGADISYFTTALGLIDKERVFELTTSKNGDIMDILDYSYSVLSSTGKEEIIFGDGKIKKIGGKFRPEILSLKTMKDAPVSLLGFLDDRLDGGYFNGDFIYNFFTKELSGSVILQETGFKGFKIDNAAVFGNGKKLSILSDGTYKNEPFTCEIELSNSIARKLFIENLSLTLKSFIYVHSNNKNKGFSLDKIEEIKTGRIINAKNIDLHLGTFKKGNILIQNINLKGKVVNNLLDFTMSDVDFAKGKLSATGKVDFDKKKIDAYFYAQNIDSNIAAYQVFNLKEQFAGSASAFLHAKLNGTFDSVEGNGGFSIKGGALPKLGNTEFVIKKTKKKKPYKFSLSDIVKIDKSVDIDQKSDIQGLFDFTDDKIYNAQIFLDNKILSLLFEGDFNVKSEKVNLYVSGNYDDDTARKITIFHIPLYWLTKAAAKTHDVATICLRKLKRTEIQNDAQSEKWRFKIKLKGNINNPKTFVHEVLWIR